MRGNVHGRRVKGSRPGFAPDVGAFGGSRVGEVWSFLAKDQVNSAMTDILNTFCRLKPLLVSTIFKSSTLMKITKR